MDNHPTGTAPNFTNACIVMFGVNLIWMLLALWLIWGFSAVILAGLAVNHGLSLLDQRRRVLAVQSIRRGKRS